MKTFDETSAVLAGYLKVADLAPDSRWAVYAENSHARLLPAFQAAQQQVQKMQLEKINGSRGSRSGFGRSSGLGGATLGF